MSLFCFFDNSCVCFMIGVLDGVDQPSGRNWIGYHRPCGFGVKSSI